jgi:hypothetical protein
MNPRFPSKLARAAFVALGCLLCWPAPARASVDDAISGALEAAAPYVKEGFTVREEQSGGDLAVGERRAIRYQLFKGNEYWFWGAVDVPKAKFHLRVVDGNGHALESERWERGLASGIRVVPPTTGSYHVVIEILGSPEERTGWAVVYGFR